jgi:O-6-methylguanine DNA methyltransferase
MQADGFALFDTRIGRCGIAWRGRAVVGVQLPEANATATRARLRRLFPDASETTVPGFVRTAIDGIVASVAGEPADLSTISLDMTDIPPFHRKVYEAARDIPPGRTVTYGGIATEIGSPRSARAVGQALGRNPFAIVVPCHRVVAAGGGTGGFSASGGVATKMRLLDMEKASTPAAGDPGTAERPDGLAALTATAPALTAQEREYAFDPDTAVAHLRKKDRTLARLIDRAGPFRMRMNTAPTTFAMLAEALVYQQLSGKAAATIFGRLRALYGRTGSGPRPGDILGTDEQTLRGVGLSRAKALAVTDLALKVEQGSVAPLGKLRTMSDDDVRANLVAVRGIGPWTAEMFLIFRLGRPDVLPLDDFGVRKGVKLTYRLPDLPDKKELAAMGERWRPFRTVAAWYFWQALELAADEPA